MPNVNIDNLAAFAHDRNDETAWRALWDAVVHLPAWYAVGDAQRPDAPLVLTLRDQPTVIAFTDEHKARAFIKSGAAANADTSTVIPMALPGALGFLARLAARGVTQIIFNLSKSSSGFGYGLAGLPRLAAALGVSDPAAPPPPPAVPTGDPRLDELAAAFAADPGEAAGADLFRYVYGLPAWHLLARADGPQPRPLLTMLGGSPVFMAFTGEGLARAAAQARALSSAPDAAPASVLSLPVEEAIAAAENAAGLRGIVFNDSSNGFFAPTRNLRPMLEHFRSPTPPSPPTPPNAD